MTTNTGLRRALVSVGVTASLVGAALTIRAASLWAANGAPLSVAPVSVASVQQALDQERQRSAQLQSQLTDLQRLTAELNQALQAARDRLGGDQATADELRTSLAAAQAKLAKLEAALAGGTSRRASSTSTGAGGGADDDGGTDDD